MTSAAKIAQSLIPKFFRQRVKEQNLSVVGQPHFEDLKIEDDQPLSCKANFEVYPEIELKQYKELEVEEETPSVTDADVDKAIDSLREHAATFEVVSDRGAADGDSVAISYKGRDTKEPAAQPIGAGDVSINSARKARSPLSPRTCEGRKRAKNVSLRRFIRKITPRSPSRGKR